MSLATSGRAAIASGRCLIRRPQDELVLSLRHGFNSTGRQRLCLRSGGLSKNKMIRSWWETGVRVLGGAWKCFDQS